MSLPTIVNVENINGDWTEVSVDEQILYLEALQERWRKYFWEREVHPNFTVEDYTKTISRILIEKINVMRLFHSLPESEDRNRYNSEDWVWTAMSGSPHAIIFLEECLTTFFKETNDVEIKFDKLDFETTLFIVNESLDEIRSIPEHRQTLDIIDNTMTHWKMREFPTQQLIQSMKVVEEKVGM